MNNEIKVTLNNENVILVKAQRGVEGARGADGAEGPKGDGLEVISIYPTLLDLQTAHPTGNKGDCYAVGTSLSNEVYFWDIDNSEWSNLGSIMGPPGADGAIGVDGKSAYQIALDNGFVGTESQWLDSLVGADGANGINGTDGSDGKSAYQSALDGGFVGTELEFNEALAEVKNKQSLLVSGTNIKTINGNSILGSGDVELLPKNNPTATGTQTLPNIVTNGIKFPATQVPSADPNTLDDYEEGIWTPVNAQNSEQIGTWSTYIGRYTKIGKVVVATIEITGTGMGYNATTGYTKLTGLPFTPQGGAGGTWVSANIAGGLCGMALAINTDNALWLASPQVANVTSHTIWASAMYLVT